MRYFDDFTVDGQALLAPDAGMQITENDLDSEDTGRDESGVMHRQVTRYGVRTWALSYSSLTAEEYQYMESLFKGKAEFTFTFRNCDGSIGSCKAYRSKHSITLYNIRTGQYTGYSFNIIEC